MKYKINVIIALLLAVILFRCDENPKENKVVSKETTKKETTKKSNVNKFRLENNGIDLTLPQGFKRISAADYQLFLEANYTKKTLEYEKDRIKELRKKEGHFYMYFNDENASTFTVNVSDPLDVDNNAQGLLNMVTAIHTEAKKETDREYQKITAGFSNNLGISIFKALYKVVSNKEPNPMFEHSYIITTDDLSLIMTLTTPEEIDFDPYIQKIDF